MYKYIVFLISVFFGSLDSTGQELYNQLTPDGFRTGCWVKKDSSGRIINKRWYTVKELEDAYTFYNLRKQLDGDKDSSSSTISLYDKYLEQTVKYEDWIYNKDGSFRYIICYDMKGTRWASRYLKFTNEKAGIESDSLFVEGAHGSTQNAILKIRNLIYDSLHIITSGGNKFSLEPGIITSLFLPVKIDKSKPVQTISIEELNGTFLFSIRVRTLIIDIDPDQITESEIISLKAGKISIRRSDFALMEISPLKSKKEKDILRYPLHGDPEIIDLTSLSKKQYRVTMISYSRKKKISFFVKII